MIKLKEVLSIKLGLNLSRQADKATLSVYSNTDLMNDLSGVSDKFIFLTGKPYDVNHSIYEGDVVYSFINSLSAIVRKNNSGKIINQNFAKIEIDETRIDSKYLCYLLNEDKEVDKQKFISMQGTALRKLSPTTIREFEVELPSLEKQKKIGQLYFDWMKRQGLAKRQFELEEAAFLEFLNRINTNNEK